MLFECVTDLVPTDVVHYCYTIQIVVNSLQFFHFNLSEHPTKLRPKFFKISKSYHRREDETVCKRSQCMLLAYTHTQNKYLQEIYCR